MNRLAVAGVAAALILGAASAQASTTRVTPGWAGYVVHASGGSFTGVKGTWVQPEVSCNRPGSSAAFWVGLGGTRPNSRLLEQIGTSAECSDSAVLSTSAWYQLFPAPAVALPMTIRAGDVVTAEVAVSGGTVELSLRDASTGESFSTERWLLSPETDSAEWIVEAPAMCFVTCVLLPLADFDRVSFRDASASVDAHTGAIGDAAWSRERLAIGSSRGRRTVAPTSLTFDGSAFDVLRSQRPALHKGASRTR
jgi:Peptidase A4 family